MQPQARAIDVDAGFVGVQQGLHHQLAPHNRFECLQQAEGFLVEVEQGSSADRDCALVGEVVANALVRQELLLGAGASRWMPRCASRATSDQVRGRLRAGLERLLRYRARAPFALERLEQLAHD